MVAKTFRKPASRLSRGGGAWREVKLARIARGRDIPYLHEDGPSTLKSVLLAARTTARTCTSTWNLIYSSQAEPDETVTWVAERWDQGGNGRRSRDTTDRNEGRRGIPLFRLRIDWIDAWPHVWSGFTFRCWMWTGWTTIEDVSCHHRFTIKTLYDYKSG